MYQQLLWFNCFEKYCNLLVLIYLIIHKKIKNMKKCMKSFWMFAALAVVFSVTGCSSGDNDKVVPVTDIQLRKGLKGGDATKIITQLKLVPGAIAQLNATVLPENATQKRVEFSSSDPTIAKVNIGGFIEAVKPGSTQILAKTPDGKITVSVDVTVKDVDYAKKVEGDYIGNLLYSNSPIIPNLPIKLEYKVVNKVSLSAAGLLPAAVINPALASFGMLEISLFAEELTVTLEGEENEDGEVENGEYQLLGNGLLNLPPPMAPYLDGYSSVTMKIAGTIDYDGKINLKLDIFALGETNYVGQKNN